MKKSTLIMILSLVLAVAIGIGSTMAYLQDTDEDVNVMTLGSVYITQNEQEYNEAGELVPFTQDKPMFPAVGTPAWNVTDESTEEENAWRQFTGLENVVDKYVTVTNTGKSDAYVRTLVALEMGELDINAFAGVFGLSVNIVDGAEFDFPGTWEIVDDDVYTINGKTYNVMTFEHQDALVPGETTIPSILQMYLKGEATTNETMEKIDGNGNGKYDVLVLSQAVQTQGFADANTALNTAFGEINQDNVQEWFANIGKNIGTPGDKWPSNNPPSFVPEDAKTIANAEELTAALAEGGEYYVVEDILLENTTLNIKNGTEVILNMNGKTIEGQATNSSASKLIEVQYGAKLTIQGEGVIEATAANPDTDWGEEGSKPYPGYATNTIVNRGELVIDGVTVANHTARGGASYAIDNYDGATLTVKSGKVIQDGEGGGDVAIRLFSSSATADNKVVIEGGDISGRRALWIQLTGSNSSVAPLTTVEISGGTLTGTDPEVEPAVYSYSFGNSFANTNVTITGGTFNGNVAFGGGYKGDQENVTITGGTFNGYLGRYLADDGWEDIAKP